MLGFLAGLIGPLGSLVAWLWGLVHSQPSETAKLGEQVGAESAEASSLEAENAELKTSAALDAQSEFDRVRAGGTGSVTTDPNAPVNRTDAADFRD